MKINNHKKLLGQLLREIRSHEVGRHWSMPLTNALRIFDIFTVEEYLCHTHIQSNPSQSLHDPLQLSHINFAEFLVFLTRNGFPECRMFFQMAGYYFSLGKKQALLNAFAKNSLVALAHCARQNTELLQSIVMSSADFKQAMTFFSCVCFSLEKHIARQARSFLQTNKIRCHNTSINNACDILHKHYLASKYIGNEKWEALISQAILPEAKKYLPKTKKSFHTKIQRIAINSHTQQALKKLGLATTHLPDKQLLKKAYYALIKKHHPDTRKSEQSVQYTQKIIKAYNIVADEITQSS